MPVISIFSGSPAIRRQVEELIQNLAGEQPDTLQAKCYETFPGFLSSAKNAPRRILLLAQEGPRSLDMALEVRERFPDNCFVWFSELDFTLFSCRLDADYFSLLPATEDKLRAALRNCMCHVCHHTPVQTKPAEKPVVSVVPVVKSRLFTTFFLCYNIGHKIRKSH